MATNLSIDLVFEHAGGGGALEAGLQDTAGNLDAGTPEQDGAVRFVTEVTLRRQPDGTVRYSGRHVHGPSAQRFLYVSFRWPGDGNEWQRRVKIPLPDRLDEHVERLSGRWRDRGTPRAAPVDGGWTSG
jgi:hypothetical protein